MTTYRDEIKGLLQAIEQATGYTVIYAVDAGSRARGLGAETSDHDLRFVYVPPTAWYFRVDRTATREVLDKLDWAALGLSVPATIDAAGMELTKFLGLVLRSNPTALEWLASPLLYVTTPLGQSVAHLWYMIHRRSALVQAYASQARNQARQGWPEGATVKDWLMFLVPALSSLESLSSGNPPSLDFDALTWNPAWPVECMREATNLATAKRLGQGGRVVEAGEVAALTAWAAQYVERSKTFDLPPEKISDNLRVAIEQITDRASAGWR